MSGPNLNDKLPVQCGSWWLFPDGTRLPVVSGGSDPSANQDPAGGTPPAPPPGTPPPSGDKPPAIDDLNKLNEWAKSFGAREKAEGKAVVEKEIAETLGMTLPEAKKLLEKHLAAEREQMTEAEKKEADAKKLREDARNETRVAHGIILDMIKQDALMSLGMDRLGAKGAVNLNPRELVAKTEDETIANVAEWANQVKTLYPQLFTGVGRSGPVHSANGGSPPPPTGNGSNSARDRATARLRERRGGRLWSDITQEPRPGEIDATRRSV